MSTIDMVWKVAAGLPRQRAQSGARPIPALDGSVRPLEPMAGEHFFMGSGERGHTGILLIHRLGGMPGEMLALAHGLNLQGYTVLAVKLAGHCGSVQDLTDTSWLDWLASVRRGADVLASRVDRVVVGGVATGAVLALALAQERPFHVAGVLALSPVFRQDGHAMPRIAGLAFLWPVLRVLGKGSNRALAGRPRHAGLPGTPWRSLGEMRKLAAFVLRRMDVLRAPCLVVHARHDDTAPLSNALKIVHRARSTNVQLQLLADRHHVIAMGRGCGDVVSRVAAFVDEVVCA